MIVNEYTVSRQWSDQMWTARANGQEIGAHRTYNGAVKITMDHHRDWAWTAPVGVPFDAAMLNGIANPSPMTGVAR